MAVKYVKGVDGHDGGGDERESRREEERRSAGADVEGPMVW